MRLFALIFFALVQLAACGDDGTETLPASCNSSNCMGCCQGNFCIDTPTDSACGAKGEACFTCAVGTSCQAGSCEFSSAACQRSCPNGCCQDGLCLAGTGASACGGGGQLCADCAQLGQTCDPVGRLCVGTTPLCSAATCAGCCNGNVCQDGQQQTSCGKSGASCRACTGSELCTAQQCVVPDMTYDLMLGRVVYEMAQAWCLELTCDPWIELRFAGEVYESSHQAGNSVVFDEVLVSGVSALALKSSGFEFILWDDDGGGANSRSCDAIVRVTDWDLSVGEIVVDCTDSFADYVSVADVSFKFIPTTP